MLRARTRRNQRNPENVDCFQSCGTSKEKREGATGSLIIVGSGHGPSHPCGVAQRIAIASDAP